MKTFDRRSLLKFTAAAPVALSLPRVASASAMTDSLKPSDWRTFQITTRVDLAAPRAQNQAWVPVPAVNEEQWFKSLGSEWKTNGIATLKHDPNSGAQFVHVEWTKTEAVPFIEVSSRVAMRDRTIDLSKPGSAAALSAAERAKYTRGTELIPIDGIVKETSDKITAGASGDLAKARAIYEWVVDNTFRDAKTRGCGIGDIAAMLRTGNLSGKCADLNALYVGLARASGLAARDVYGIRVAPSKLGYRSLGANSETITGAQHCRAETYIAGLGWVPTDPADVRKVVLEEPPGNLPVSNDKVVAARDMLFGAWEGNWLAYNFAHDVALPGSNGPKLGFLMYPQGECGPDRLDCLDPKTFSYSITSKDVTT